MKRFYFHFNKPQSKKLGKTIWSVHYAGKCHQVEKVHCLVNSETKANKHQPYAIVQGFCKEFLLNKNECTIL